MFKLTALLLVIKFWSYTYNVQSDGEEDIEELMDDSDTEFFANDKDIENIVPEANIHIVKDNEKEQGKKSKTKLKEVQFQWRHNVAPDIREEYYLVGEVCHPLEESTLPLEVYVKVVNLDVLILLLVTQSNLYSQQNGRHFITNPE